MAMGAAAPTPPAPADMVLKDRNDRDGKTKEQRGVRALWRVRMTDERKRPKAEEDEKNGEGKGRGEAAGQQGEKAKKNPPEA